MEHSVAYERIKRLYLAGSLTLAQLDNAVLKKWITAVEEQEIIDAKVIQDLG